MQQKNGKRVFDYSFFRRGGGQGRDNSEGGSCLALAGRVTLAGGTTFLHINTYTRLPGTTYGVASVS